MMNTIEIIGNIRQLKNTGKKMFSNCFMQFQKYNEEEWDAVTTKSSLCIVNRDHAVNRIWFYTIDFDDLGEIIKNQLSLETEYVIDILSKDVSLYQKELEKWGFSQFTRMMRISNRDVSPIIKKDSALMKYYNPDIGENAKLDDAEEINKKLWEIFDSRISYLQNLDELKESIKRKEVCIYKTGSGIEAILQRIIEPKSFYINQIYNGTEKQVIHAMLLNELKRYCESGGKYAYAWVEECNSASRRFHGKYGLEHDGLWNIVYKKYED